MYHNHKKRKDSQEKQVELAVLCSCFENQDILEPTLLYRASKYIENQEQGNNTLYGSTFYLFVR